VGAGDRPAVTALEDYGGFADRLRDTGLVTDPWVEGAPRFRARPHVISAGEKAALDGAAEAVAAVHHQLVCRVLEQPSLLDDFFGLTPAQKLMFLAGAPLWHGLARADVFLVDGRPPQVCELNCDTPSGLAEAAVLGRLGDVSPAGDPNARLEARFGRLLETFAASTEVAASGITVGLVYPTELAGDFGLLRLYQDWCQRRGLATVLGSPFNLHATPDGGVGLFGRRCDLLVRHYKTDWWGERRPIWDDEVPYADAEPLAGPLALVLSAVSARRCAVVNPFAAVLPQNKRAMAFLWEEQHRFDAEARAIIRDHVPETVRLERADRAQLRASRAEWVLKSDYGCEGEEVVIGRATDHQAWAACLERALPGRWIAQRYFSARRDDEGLCANHGVFLIGGQAAGLYTRLSAGATDAAALSVPVQVTP
jgi:hypothetical protein